MEDYYEFKFIDIKTNELINHTCNPYELCSDFEENNSPYYFNPVFFNKEVFSKYKMNMKKYIITSDYIVGNEWDIRYYTTDDEEQIIVLLRDLAFIPPNEQIYWKSFNEPPSSIISEKIFKNYIMGEWVNADDLIQLKNNLRNFPQCNIDANELYIWTEPQIENQHSLDYLTCINIESKTEWEDEIQTLYLNIINGFNTDTINFIAKKMGCYNKKYKSLKQLQNCLNNLKDIPSSEVDEIMDPLYELNYYQIKVISHTISEKYPEENLQINFKRLIMNLNISISFLRNIVQVGFFDFKNE